MIPRLALCNSALKQRLQRARLVCVGRVVSDRQKNPSVLGLAGRADQVAGVSGDQLQLGAVRCRVLHLYFFRVPTSGALTTFNYSAFFRPGFSVPS